MNAETGQKTDRRTPKRKATRSNRVEGARKVPKIVDFRHFFDEIILNQERLSASERFIDFLC